MKWSSSSRTFSIWMLLLASISGQAVAADQTNGNESDDASYSLFDNSPNSRATLTGDWGGVRTYLRNRGIEFGASWTNETAGNVTGGDRRTAAQTNQITAGLDVNAEKLLHWKGASFNFTFTWRSGRNLITDAGLYTLQQPQEVWGRGQTTRLTQLWYNQNLGSGFSFKVGRLPTGADFDNVPCLTMIRSR